MFGNNNQPDGSLQASQERSAFAAFNKASGLIESLNALRDRANSRFTFTTGTKDGTFHINTNVLVMPLKGEKDVKLEITVDDKGNMRANGDLKIAHKGAETFFEREQLITKKAATVADFVGKKATRTGLFNGPRKLPKNPDFS